MVLTFNRNMKLSFYTKIWHTETTRLFACSISLQMKTIYDLDVRLHLTQFMQSIPLFNFITMVAIAPAVV